VIGVPPAGARGTRPSGRSFAVARHPLSGAVGCPSGCRLDSVQDVDAAAKEPTCVIARKTRKSSKVSEFCDESKAAVAHFPTSPLPTSPRPIRRPQPHGAEAGRRVCPWDRRRRVAKPSFHELSGALAAISFAL